jgi:hypothetical protein
MKRGDFHSWFQGLVSLALLPLDCVELEFSKLSVQMNDELSMNPLIGANGLKFLKYFKLTYMQGNF